MTYECCGDWNCETGNYWTPSNRNLQKAWGKVTEVSAYHYDEATEEETEFSDDDMTELFNALDMALENL